MSSPDDVAFVVELAERAAAAHRAAPGEEPKPPPTGSDLEPAAAVSARRVGVGVTSP